VSPLPEYEGADLVLPTLRRNLQRNVNLQHDEAQQAAFEALCTQRVGLVVGPPGTGKSFLGSQIAQAILGVSSDDGQQPLRMRLLVFATVAHSAPSFGKVAETHVLSSLFATLNRAH